MSHKTELKTKLDNLSYITKGLDDLGIKYTVARDGQKLTTKGRYNVHEKVDILITEVKNKQGKSISTNDAIGFQKQEDGTYTAIGDFFGMSITSTELRNIVTTSAKKAEANDRLMQLGYSLENTNDHSNELEMTFTRWV